MSEQTEQRDIRNIIRTALGSITSDNFFVSATRLLEIIGYKSRRILADQTGSVDDFINTFPAYVRGDTSKRNTKSDEVLCNNIDRIRVLFQLTEDEITADEGQVNLPLSELSEFNEGWVKSFLFVAAEMSGEKYSRGKYAQFTREINRRFAQPTVVLFRTATNLLTLAFVHRREHKHSGRDVLGSVSLIREINSIEPHRAHMDILSELSLSECLSWIDAKKQQYNFDSLLTAWLDKLNTDKLNRKFYTELFDWFIRAVEESRFPTDEARTLSDEEHIIRLITRLLFVWFIKEKGLVAEDLFNKELMPELLVKFDLDSGDSYYRTVLQNLFFATLNTEIKKRGFSSTKDVTHRIFSLYRYKREIRDEKELLALFAKTPFINGGLFDCLDSEESTKNGGYSIDCFSDVHYKKLSIPDRLFFDDDGLFPLLNRYKFTVEENTPIEQEVALDPELLGKVFENLLAAFNPETRDVVRSQVQLEKSKTERNKTGSYYTPRTVVDYMVDEALVSSLVINATPNYDDMGFWRDRLRYLLDYKDAFDDASELFEKEEIQSVVKAISDIKVLDPAVGSGAFPMGILHKLTLALQRLDPGNQYWKALQKERAKKRADEAFETKDQEERDAELLEISETFERYSSDFGRKLYLIQNSIFGVDIQPVACQIAKLRFFISLAVEQTPDFEDDNFGIKPLPNLETNFVVADTLLSLERPEQMTIWQIEQITELEQKLAENRERHFHATTRKKKLACKDENAILRKKLAEVLEEGKEDDDSSSVDAAEKIAHWDAYDQNNKADWFDPEYMLGVNNGFDIVIGNPPYIQLQKNGGELADRYDSADFISFARSADIYQLFYEKGCQLLRSDCGLLSFITSNSWLKAKYGKPLRNYISNSHSPLLLLEMGKGVFDNAIVDTNILILRKGQRNIVGKAVDMDRLPNKKFPPDDSSWGELRPQGDSPWMSLSAREKSIMDKMEDIGTPLKEWDISIYRGILTGYNKAFIIDKETKEALVEKDPMSAEIIKPVLRGKDIKRYQAEWAGLWLIMALPSLKVDIDSYPAIKEHLLSFGKDRLEQSGKSLQGGGKSRKKTPHKWFELQDTCAYHELFEHNKILWMHMSPRGRFAYSDSEIYCNQKAFIMTGTSLKYLCAVLNSRPVTWIMKNTAVTTGMGLLQWDKFTVDAIPVPKIANNQQRPFIDLVNKILAVKADDVSANTTAPEEEIDRLVYQLYDLTDTEIEAIKAVDY